ncbi:MAG: phosphatidate cytidylyltransferase [Pseudomonadota bacterium]
MTEAPTQPERFADLRIRTLSALVFGALCLICAIIGGYAAILLGILLYAFLIWEYHAMATGERELTSPPLLVLQAGGVISLAVIGSGALTAGIAAYLATVLAAGVMARQHFAFLAPGAVYVGFAVGALVYIRIHQDDGLLLIVWVICVVIACDVGAYFAGRSIGGRKLCPSISPGKTCSGGIGGLIGAVLFSLVFSGVLGWPLLSAALAALLIGVASQLGDLGESWMKRRAGIKDSGVLMPGHGGFLDRLDGILGGTWAFLLLDAFKFGDHLTA